MASILDRWAPRFLSVLRVVSAFLVIWHGTQKFFGFPAPRGPAPEFLSMIWFAGVLELAGGALLLIGLCTRPVAFVLSGFMAAAYFIGHAPKGFWPILNGGELAVLWCFVYLYLFAAGGGPWSVDAMRRRS